jgi:phage/plasmid-like protein (TIGR03299 family)
MEHKEMLVKANLDWSVRTEKVVTESGIHLPNIAIVREDTNKVIGLHSDGYVPYQNSQLIELMDRVTTLTGLELKKGGSFKDGARVFVQMKSDNMTLGTDRIEGFVTGINSFDGSTSLGFGPSNVTISCMNTFFAAYRGLTKVRHTKSMEIRIDQICRDIDSVLEQEKEIFKKIKRMSETPVFTNDYDQLIDMVQRKLFNIRKEESIEDFSTVTKNRIQTFTNDLKGEIAQKGMNSWGVFSGITKYTTHSMNGNSTENKIFGTYGDRERVLFNELVAFGD